MTRKRSRRAASWGAHMPRLKGWPWMRTTTGPSPVSSWARSTGSMEPMVTGRLACDPGSRLTHPSCSYRRAGPRRNAMKPRFHGVLAQWKPVSSASGRAGCRDGRGYLCRPALAEEVAQGGDDEGRGFLGEEVAGGQGLTADVGINS